MSNKKNNKNSVKKNNNNCGSEIILSDLNIYEKDIKSIFYFFNNFKRNDERWNQFLLPKYQMETKIENIKHNLKELKEKQIYDYSKENSSQKSNYIKLFNILYNKKQIYDFLLNHEKEDIQQLYEKIDNSFYIINFKDIVDTHECVSFFNELKNMNNFEILEQVKKIENDLIEKFQNFSKKYELIIEFYYNYDIINKLYLNIKDIITDFTFVFYTDNEIFTVINNEKKSKNVTIDELKNIKNKINQNYTKYEQFFNKEKFNFIFSFINLVNNIEIIYNYMKFLRKKGISLPIYIKITLYNNIIKYYLETEEQNFSNIEQFLFNVKNNIINKLDDIYKNNEYLRFLYGIQLNSILKHLDSKIKIESIIRFILDNANDRDTINDGFIANNVTSHDYINNSNIYLDNIFENISKYLNSLFQNNGLSLKNHYKNMRIFTKEDYKGIYQIQSLSGTMENDILKIFLKLTGRLPVAQNILIINNDSLYEEIQSFFFLSYFLSI